MDNNVDPRDHPFIMGATVPGTRRVVVVVVVVAGEEEEVLAVAIAIAIARVGQTNLHESIEYLKVK